MRFTFASGDRPIAGYTIKRGIGRGGFGEVYYAVSDGGKDVALKLVQRHLDVELRGARQCMNLKHPNLVELYNVIEIENGDCWVAMEYMSGDRLEEVVARHTVGMGVSQAVQYMKGLCTAAEHLHSKGIVHRDLKPGNVFVEHDTVKLGDYGLSKFITASRRSGHTESIGTVHYMAPEIANGRYGKEIDIYALGIMFYEMLTGSVPFQGQTVAEVLMKHLTSQPDMSPVPEKYRPVLRLALEKDPDKRIKSAAELLALCENPENAHVLAEDARYTAFKPGNEPTAEPAFTPPQPPPIPLQRSTPQTPSTGRLDIGRCFNDAIAVYQENWLVLGAISAVYSILTLLSLLVLSGPLAGGIAILSIAAVRNPRNPVDFADLFSSLDRFGRLFAIGFVTGIVTLLGYMACGVPGFIFSTLFMYPFFLATDRNMPFWDSITTSVSVVTRKGFAINLGLFLITFGLELGACAVPYLGVIISMFVAPVGWLMVASAYEQQITEDRGELSDVLNPQVHAQVAQGVY